MPEPADADELPFCGIPDPAGGMPEIFWRHFLFKLPHNGAGKRRNSDILPRIETGIPLTGANSRINLDFSRHAGAGKERNKAGG
jgi:hypothetical protein